jgi:hypothetical protein
MSVGSHAYERARRKFGTETLSIDVVSEGFYDGA